MMPSRSLSRQVIGGTSLITAAGIAARMLSVLMVPILSALLGPGPYGVAALVGTVTSLASVFALLGIDMAYSRFFLQSAPDQQAAVERFCWRFALCGSLITVVLAGLGWTLFGARWVSESGRIGLYSSGAILAAVAVTMATTRRRLMGNYGRIAVAMFLGSAGASAVSVCLAIWGWRDAWPLLLGTLASSVATMAVLGLPEPRVVIEPSALPTTTRGDIVMFGVAGAVAAPMHWLISSADRWFIAEYAGTSEAGIYSMAASLATIGLMLNNSLTLTWFPEASRLYGERGADALDSLGRLWVRLVAGLAIVWLAVSTAGGDVLRLLAAPAFHSGAASIPWLAGGVFFYGLAALGTTAIFLRGRMRIAAYIWTGGALACLGLNALLVPRFGGLGAAQAQCLTYALMSVLMLGTSHRIMPMRVPAVKLAATLTAVLVIGVLASPAWARTPIWSLCIKLPVGVLSTWVVLLVMAPDWHGRLRKMLLSGKVE